MIRITVEKCGFEQNLVVGCINIGIYGIFGDNKFLNKILYPIMILDRLISKFKISTKIGLYLICVGKKRKCKKNVVLFDENCNYSQSLSP